MPAAGQQLQGGVRQPLGNLTGIGNRDQLVLVARQQEDGLGNLVQPRSP
jgi:hypothetical protein